MVTLEYIHFRLFNQIFELTIPSFNELLCLYSISVLSPAHVNFNEETF